MNAKVVLSPSQVMEIVRKYVADNTDCDVNEAIPMVSCERDELPTFDGISVTVKLKDRVK